MESMAEDGIRAIHRGVGQDPRRGVGQDLRIANARIPASQQLVLIVALFCR